jgi:hypothetical protein
MDFAPNAPERSIERQKVLAAVKFVGLSRPAAEEPEPGWIAKLRSLLFRASGRPGAARP